MKEVERARVTRRVAEALATVRGGGSRGGRGEKEALAGWANAGGMAEEEEAWSPGGL